MSTYDSMKKSMQTTGLYTLDGKTSVDFELQAYAAGDRKSVVTRLWKA